MTHHISTFEGGNALSAFRAQQLQPALQAIHPKIESIAARFFNTLARQGVMPIRQLAFADHQAYSEAELRALTTGSQALIMTEKDAVKCTAFANEKCWVLRVDAQLDSLLTQQILERLTPDGR